MLGLLAPGFFRYFSRVMAASRAARDCSPLSCLPLITKVGVPVILSAQIALSVQGAQLAQGLLVLDAGGDLVVGHARAAADAEQHPRASPVENSSFWLWNRASMTPKYLSLPAQRAQQPAAATLSGRVRNSLNT